MLTKIVSIKNVGRFANYGAGGDMQLRRYNLVYAPNGRGKTTICAILRSLRNGQPEFITGRRTLGSTGDPEVKLLCSVADLNTFDGKQWNKTFSSIAIFDSTFITENVHIGDFIDLEQKRNLYRVIIGSQGIALASAVDEIDEAIRGQNTVIATKRNSVQYAMPKTVKSVEEFLDLKPIAECDTKISEKVQELKTAQKATQINERELLSELPLPALPSDFLALLAKTIEGIGAEAEQKVAQQIKEHQMHEHGQEWLSEGLSYIHDDKCAFCGNNVSGNVLIQAYRVFFGKAYGELKKDIEVLRQRVEDSLGVKAAANIEKKLIQNSATTEFWAEFVTVNLPKIEYATAVEKQIQAMREDALRLIDKKSASLLDPVPEDITFQAMKAAFQDMRDTLTAYNAVVKTVNTTIQKKKSTTQTLNEKSIETDLTALKTIRERYATETAELCTDLKNAITQKKVLEDKKREAKDKLDTHSDALIGNYETRINALLKSFNAGFSILNIKRIYPGGTPSSTYQILINGTAVDLGDSGTPIEMPSFKNTLSAGDKSTLAFAFFLAQLEQDPAKKDTVVVFDDPFNSQDRSRRTLTKDLIRKCGQECKQVIVFSHDPYFLKHLFDGVASSETKSLQLSRVGVSNTVIEPWDIEKETTEGYFTEHATLTAYLQHGAKELRDIARKIRPVLEGYCRYRFPGQFADNDWLADMIDKIRLKGPEHPLFGLVDEIESIKDFSKKYHHDTNGATADTEIIDDGELQGFVKRTLNIVGGY